MAVNGISGLNITGTLSNGDSFVKMTKMESDRKSFANLVDEIQRSSENKNLSMTGLSSSQVSFNHKLNGDYTQGFYGTYTSEKDKVSDPVGFAANSSNGKGKKITIDRTSDLYVQSMEMENYMVKMMLSSMRNTIQKSDLYGNENSYARDMYEDMMYDNLAESFTKNAQLGIADQIYIELSGQR